MPNTFPDYWSALCQANPGLGIAQAKMTISAAVFRAQLEKAYLAGARDHAAVIKELEGVGLSGKKNNPFDDLFGGLFG